MHEESGSKAPCGVKRKLLPGHLKCRAILFSRIEDELAKTFGNPARAEERIDVESLERIFGVGHPRDPFSAARFCLASARRLASGYVCSARAMSAAADRNARSRPR